MKVNLPKTIKQGVSGFRGIFPDPLSVELVLRLSKALGTFFKGKRIVFGTDTRLSRDTLGSSVKAGLTSCGCDVIDLGIVPTPTVEVCVLHFKAAAGIILSASHNPAEWNALKIVGSDGCFLTIERIKRIVEIYEKGEFNSKPYNKTGRITHEPQGIQIHINNVLKNKFTKKYIKLPLIAKKNFRIFVDVVNGAGGAAIPDFFKQLKISRYKILNPDPDIEFSHVPEPSKKNLKSTLKFLKGKRFDICFVVDPDADRLAIINDHGEYISEEFTQALASYSVLEYKKGPIVTNLSSSMLMNYIGDSYKVPVFRSSVGEANVVMMMKQHRAVIGGEGNGGVIFPPAHYGRDSLVGMLLILDLLARKKVKLSKLLEKFPTYHIIKAKKYSENGYVDRDLILNYFPDGEIDDRDGIKITFKDSWVHIRASATEPVIRVIAEACSKKKANNLIEKVLNII